MAKIQVQVIPQLDSDNIKGILWALLATALFAIVAAMAKVAIDEYHVFQILFFRQIVVFTSCIPSVLKTFPEGFKTKYLKIHAMRLIGAFIALSCGIWAVAVLPLTTAITLGFAQVFFVVILALGYLNERVGVYRVVAVIVGFIGVVVVMRPGAEGIVDVRAFIPLFGAFGASMAVISVRKLSQTESTATLLIYQALFVGVLAGVPLIWLWVSPDISGLFFLLTMGVFATIGQWLGVKALRLGEASVVGHVQYMQLIFAAILGYFLFNEIPDVYTLAGAIVIIASSIYIFHCERLSKKIV